MPDPKDDLAEVDRHKKLNEDYRASILRVQELRKGRIDQDIPLTDEYWTALKHHRAAFKVSL